MCVCVFVKMAEGEDIDVQVKAFATAAFREIVYLGGEGIALDFLDSVFFSPLPTGLFDKFCRDAEFLKWERELFLERSESQLPPVLKVVEGFAEIVQRSVKVFLFEVLTIPSKERMKDIVFGSIMVDRWLFADKTRRGRARALKIHKRQALRRALRSCQGLDGFTGNTLFFFFSFV